MLSTLNYTLFQALNNQAGEHPWLDAIMVFSANWLIFGWLLFFLIAWGKPLSWRKQAASESTGSRILEIRSAILWTVVACLLAYAINLTIEQFVFEPRPFMSHHVHLLAAHTADASFPSDHTAWSFAALGMFLLSLWPWLADFTTRKNASRKIFQAGLLPGSKVLLIVAIVMACIIGIARVFIGVHYPDDIIGGAIDGLVAAYVTTCLRHWLRRPTEAVLSYAQRLHIA